MNINLNNPSRSVRSLGRIIWLLGWLPLALVSGLIIIVGGAAGFVCDVLSWTTGGRGQWANTIVLAIGDAVEHLWTKWNILKFS